MKIDTTKVPEHVRQIAKRLQEVGHQSWIVGGCVRDLIRGKEEDICDWDLATTAHPDVVLSSFSKVIPTGVQHGTVTVMMEGEGYEVTTLRGEGTYSDGRRPDEVFFVDTIEEDLSRRDMTCNAIAADVVSGEITDPFNGVQDMEDKLLRAVGDPMDRFREDGLRVMRAARFCAVLGYSLDSATEAAIAPNLETFSKVARERVLAEWVKAVERSEYPSIAFAIMWRTGILHRIATGLSEAMNVAGAYSAILIRLDSAPRSFVLATAAMLLEVGMGHTEVERWLRSMKTSTADREKIMHLLTVLNDYPSFSDVCKWDDAEVRRWFSRGRRRHLPDVLSVFLSNRDPIFGGSQEYADYIRARFDSLSSAPLEISELAVNGDEVQVHLGIKPGKKLGDVLKALLEAVLSDPQRNTREKLLALATTML